MSQKGMTKQQLQDFYELESFYTPEERMIQG